MQSVRPLKQDGSANQQSFSNEVILHVFIADNRGEIVTSEPAAGAEVGETDAVGDADTMGETNTMESDTAGTGNGEETIDNNETMGQNQMVGAGGATAEGTSDAAVQAFAQRMMREHSNVLQRAEDLAAQLNLEPQPNLLSFALENAAQGTAEELRTLSGEELNRKYILAQIAMHQNTLNMLNYTLIPNAENEELRSLLEEARTTVAEHLEEAQTIHESMMAAMP